MMKIERHFLIWVVIFSWAIVLGSYAYQAVEGWRPLDAVYFVVITITTIGYGDFYPQTDLGKIFTIFFSFFGIAMAFYFLSLITQFIARKHETSRVARVRKDLRDKEVLEKKLAKVRLEQKKRRKKK